MCQGYFSSLIIFVQTEQNYGGQRMTTGIAVPIILIQLSEQVLDGGSNHIFLALRNFSSKRKRLPHTSPITEEYMTLEYIDPNFERIQDAFQQSFKNIT